MNYTFDKINTQKVLSEQLLNKIQQTQHTSFDLEHAKKYGYLNNEHKNIFAKIHT